MIVAECEEEASMVVVMVVVVVFNGGAAAASVFPPLEMTFETHTHFSLTHFHDALFFSSVTFSLSHAILVLEFPSFSESISKCLGSFSGCAHSRNALHLKKCCFLFPFFLNRSS